MNEHPAHLFSIGYRMQRGDYVALTGVLTRRRPERVVAELCLYFGLLLAIVAIAAGSPGRVLPTLDALVRSRDFPVGLAVVLLGPALLLVAPWITRLVAAAIYRRHAMAGREVDLHLTADGIEGGATDLYARIGWAAVTRLVETPRHLFILISRREALIIPRRAVPDEDLYNNIKGFIRARTGLATSG